MFGIFLEQKIRALVCFEFKNTIAYTTSMKQYQASEEEEESSLSLSRREQEAGKGNHLIYSGKKRSWTVEEDSFLTRLVLKYGAQRWTTIAQRLPGI